MIRNFIYEVKTGLILSLHSTNNECEEALSSYYSGKPFDYPSDRAMGQLKFPMLVAPKDIIGSYLSAWTERKDPQVYLSSFPCTTRFVLVDSMNQMIQAAYDTLKEAQEVAVDHLYCSIDSMPIPETISNLVLIGSQITDWKINAEVSA